MKLLLSVFSFVLLCHHTAHASLLSPHIRTHRHGKDSSFQKKLNIFPPGTRRAQTCGEVLEDELVAELTSIRDTHLKEECIKDESSQKWCDRDMFLASITGAYDTANEMCQDNGGQLYVYDAIITCPDSSTYGFYSNPLSCFTDCDAMTLENSILSLISPAQWLNSTEASECDWFFFLVSTYGGDDGDDIFADDFSSPGDDDNVFAEDDDFSGGLCPPVQDDAYDIAFSEMLFVSAPLSCEDDNFLVCTIDFSSLVEEGAFETLNPLCTNASGNLFIISMVMSCPDGTVQTYKSVPSCMADCTVDILKEVLNVNGSPSGTDCTYNAVEVYAYGVEEHEEENDGGGDKQLDTKSPKSTKGLKGIKSPKMIPKAPKGTKTSKSSKSL